MNRRDFLKCSAASGGALLVGESVAGAMESPAAPPIVPVTVPQGASPRIPESPGARWIWYPSGRTLQNTFILFRRELEISGAPRRATGWIAADSRYRLEVNGKWVQWGPPPSDPRWPEADPLDLTPLLRSGRNAIGVTVLYYGTGDGTWPIGKPGFWFTLEIEHADGRLERVVSDAGWRAHLSRAWPPGHYKRWYLRALQEEFDARKYPYGWTSPEFEPDDRWLPAMTLSAAPGKPALSTSYGEYQLDVGSGPADTELRRRSIPMLVHHDVPVWRLAASCRLQWLQPAEDYFDFRVPEAFRVVAEPGFRVVAAPGGESSGAWEVELAAGLSAVLTFEFREQVVGWPRFTLEAPAGTTVEMLVHEAHRLDGPALLNTHFDSWSRFVCREGPNTFEPFDFESLRWLQLVIHGDPGKVIVRDIQVRRRRFPWPNRPWVKSNEPALQRLFDASLNTLDNSAQETLVDGMARERQQYSGDGGHQLHAVHLALGETRLVARYLTTWSQGLTKDGFFLDCWPAYDRLARLVERQMDLTGWGPILDHGVGFNFDCWSHYLYTGRLDDLREPYPRLVRFAQYLQSIVSVGGMLPVENLGIPSVWIDHQAYQRQRHKQCAFNLYAAAALRYALAPMARVFDDPKTAEAADAFGQRLEQAATRAFWSASRGLFVNNLPWLDDEKSPRACDRSLANALLFDQCPGGQTEPGLRALVDCPQDMGFSYPCNAGWRLWALAKGGRADVIVNDLRQRWATLTSVIENNTLQEDWVARHDSGQQWSHCAVVPLYLAFHGLMGLKPLAPGFVRLELRPQLADLTELELTAHTVRGPVELNARGPLGKRVVTLKAPEGCEAELVLSEREQVELPIAQGPVPAGHRRYRLPAGEPRTFEWVAT